MLHHLTFYTLRYKKKSYVSWYHAKISCLTGRWTLFEFILFHLAATRTFPHWDLQSVAHFDCFPLVHHKVRLFVFWGMNDILTTSCSAVTIPYMLWLKCFRLSDLISYDSQQRGLKVRTSIITYSEFTYGFQNTRSLVLDSTWFLFCDSKSHMKYAISWCILSSNRPPTQPFLCHYA